MPIDGPDYRGYSLDELLDARQHIDRERFPERASLLDDEIRRRASEPGAAPNDSDGPRNDGSLGPCGRRAIAFVIDLAIVGAAWGAVDNLLVVPVPAWLEFALALVPFLAYFVVFEGLLAVAASPGKRVMGLVVRGSSRVTVLQGLTRSTIVAALVWCSWDRLLVLDPLDRLPVIAITAIGGVQLGLFLFNIAMALKTPAAGRMIQDSATGTFVALRNEEAPVPPSRAARRFVIVSLVASLLAGIGLTTGLVAEIGSIAGESPRELLGETIREARSAPDRLEAAIASETSIRTHVEVNVRRTWTRGEPSRRTLEVKVWIPAARWSALRREEVANAALESLRVEPGTFDGGTLVLMTGISYLSRNRSYTLTFPSGPADAGPS